MRDDLGNLARLDAVIERAVELRRQLCHLITRDQGGADKPGRFQRSARVSFVYLARAGATVRMSSSVSSDEKASDCAFVFVLGFMLYCSSVTFSIQSISLPSTAPCIATCVIALVGEAPCHC